MRNQIHSAVIDENIVIAALQVPCAVPTAQHTRTASSLVLIDAYDRQILREPMMDVINTALSLNEKMREAEMIYRVIWDLEKGNLTTTYLKEAEAKFLKKADTYRVKLLSLMELISQCAEEGDTIS